MFVPFNISVGNELLFRKIYMNPVNIMFIEKKNIAPNIIKYIGMPRFSIMNVSCRK